MHSPLRVEVPDEASAQALRSYLQLPDVEVVAVNDHYEVRVEMVGHNSERRVVAALNRIDLWLVASGVPFVNVHLDGGSYELHAPLQPDHA
jgi:hypothetical protein